MAEPIKDHTTVRLCNLTGVNKTIKEPELIKRIETLRGLVKLLEMNLDEVTKAKQEADFWSAMIRGTRAVKAISVLILEYGGTFGKIGKAAVDNSETIGEATVGKFDPKKAVTRAAKSAASALPDSVGAGYQYLARNKARAADIVVDSLNGKADVVTVSKWGVAEGLDAASTLLGEGSAKQQKLGKVLKKAKPIINFALDIYKSEEEYKKNLDANRSLEGARSTVLHQLRRLQIQLDSLMGDLEACDQDLAVEQRLT